MRYRHLRRTVIAVLATVAFLLIFGLVIRAVLEAEVTRRLAQRWLEETAADLGAELEIGDLHGLSVMGDDDELRRLPEIPQHGKEPAHIGVVEWSIDLFWAAASAALAIGALILLYIALNTGEASKVVPISAAYPAVTLVLAAIFLSEAITFARAGGMLLVIAGVIVLTSVK